MHNFILIFSPNLSDRFSNLYHQCTDIKLDLVKDPPILKFNNVRKNYGKFSIRYAANAASNDLCLCQI